MVQLKLNLYQTKKKKIPAESLRNANKCRIDPSKDEEE